MATPLPSDVVEIAKQCLTDWLGVAIAGSPAPQVRAVLRQAHYASAICQANAVRDEASCHMMDSILINGTAGHALDFDSVIDACSGHPVAAIAPAVLAIARQEGHPGMQVLEALVTGVEASCALMIIAGDGVRRRGLHPTAISGAVGAAVAVGRLLDLAPNRMAAAVGAAVCLATGMTAASGTSIKSIQVGNAALQGTRAALLVNDGVSAPLDVLDALDRPSGILHGARTRLMSAENSDFMIRESLFKEYPCCLALHGVVDAALRLRGMPGFDAASVERIDVHVHPSVLDMCPFQTPATADEARFSIPFAVAVVLNGGRPEFPTTWQPDLNEPTRMSSLIGTVRARTSERRASELCRLVVSNNAGEKMIASASLRRPAARLEPQWTKIAAKFELLATPLIGRPQAEQLLEHARRLEEAEGVSDLMRMSALYGHVEATCPSERRC